MVNGHPRTTFELNLPRCALLFDGHSIIEAEGLNWKLADNDLDLKQERITFDCEVIFFFLSDFVVKMYFKLYDILCNKGCNEQMWVG